MDWDYVVVGAGSAGCVLAARLSEDPGVRVLLLEAGDRDTAREIGVPAAFSKLFKGRHDWDYTTEPEPGCDDRELYWPRGKVLGGSSSLNAMIYVRGARADYDGWDLPGWRYDDVLPLFKRSEDNSRGPDAFHGAGGPLPVSDLRSPSPLVADYLEACAQSGLPANPDFNGAEQDGVGTYQVTQRRGRRASAADAFLRPALRRPNLEVRTLAHATRVVLEDGRAVGVEADFAGRREVFRATREVVLAAGAIGTPQLLMLSGLGPADHLRQAGVDVVQDLPRVGQGLQDHLAVASVFTANAPVGYFGADRDLRAIASYVLRRRGPFSSNVAEAGGFVRTSSSAPAADLQLLFAPVMFVEHGLQDPPGHGYSSGAYLLTPQSRGSIGLRSADPFAKAVVRAGYLTERADLDRLVEGVRLCLDIASRGPLVRHSGGRFLPEPGADSDEALRAHVRATSQTIYHPTSTCAMGTGDDAVCDPQLRVRGVEGLRVADASVLPDVPRGNTHAPVVMVAERAADLLARGDRPRAVATGRRGRPHLGVTGPAGLSLVELLPLLQDRRCRRASCSPTASSASRRTSRRCAPSSCSPRTSRGRRPSRPTRTAPPAVPSGPGGRAGGAQGPVPHRRRAHDRLEPGARGLRPGRRRGGVEAAPAGRRRAARQDGAARVRLRHRLPALRQPVGPRPLARRLVRRLGGRARRAHGPGGARHRHRRPAAHPGRAVRDRRPSAVSRSGALRRGAAARAVAGHCRADGASAARRRAAAAAARRRPAAATRTTAPEGPARHRIGVVARSWEDLDASVERTCRDALELLVERGAELVDVEPPAGADEVLAVPGTYGHVVHAEALVVHERWLAEHPERYTDDVRGRLATARSTTPSSSPPRASRPRPGSGTGARPSSGTTWPPSPRRPSRSPRRRTARCRRWRCARAGRSPASRRCPCRPAWTSGLPVGLQLAALPEQEAPLVGLGLVVDEAVALWRRDPLA